MIHYSPPAPVQVEHISSSSPAVLADSTNELLSAQQGVNMEEISQYYIFPEQSSQNDCIIYNSLECDIPVDPELPLSGHLSSLQTIFLVREVGKPNYLGTRVPVPTHWDLDLLDSLLQDYDKMVVEFLRYGWPMSRNFFPLTDDSSHVNHKGALDFPNAINQYLLTEQSNNTLLGPFSHNPFPDRTASSLLNSIPKHDSEE